MKKNDEIKNETMETVVEEAKDVTAEETQNETEEKANVLSTVVAFAKKHRTKFVAGAAFVGGLLISYALNRSASGDSNEGDDLTIIDLDPTDYSAVEVIEDSYSGYEAE